MKDYFTERKEELKAKKDDTIGRIAELESTQEKIKEVIQKHIKVSKEVDETGDIWINSDSLLEELGLQEWNINKNIRLANVKPEDLKKTLQNKVEE